MKTTLQSIATAGRRRCGVCVALISLTLLPLTALAQTSVFTYQGQLTDNGVPANGSYDLAFTLFDALTAGTAIGTPQTVAATPVTNGLFTVTLDFGAGAFPGAARFLEIAARTNGAGSFGLLIPRQQITATPYAIRALNAGASTTVAPNAVGTAGLQSGAVDSSKIADGTIVAGNLSTTLLSNTFWKLTGNAGTTPSAQFLGTTDNQPLELKVNGLRGLRLEPGSSDVPNVIGGATNTAAGTLAIGGAIGGGNLNTLSNAAYGTIGGGLANFNTADNYATIAGGNLNRIETGGFAGSIGGGAGNIVADQYGTIPGGFENQASGDFSFAAGFRAKANHDGAFVWSDSASGLPFVSSGPNQFLIRASGGVGINKTNPATALHVNGTVTATAFSGDGSGLSGVAPASGSANYIQNQTAVNQSAGFRITGNGIFNGGNVGIGTTAPATTLHVRDSGDAQISVESSDSGGHRWTVQSSGLPGNSLDASFQIVDRTSGNSWFRIVTNGSVGIGRTPTANKLEVNGEASKSVAGSWLANSDARIKTAVHTVTNALEKLEQVRPVQFRYTEEYRAEHPEIADRPYLNVIAQEFQKVFPEAVKGGGDKLPNGDEILQVDTYPLTIYSAAAIQELNQKLGEKLQQKETEIAELKQRLESLEKMILKEKRN
jgi:hypothetical protein